MSLILPVAGVTPLPSKGHEKKGKPYHPHSNLLFNEDGFLSLQSACATRLHRPFWYGRFSYTLSCPQYSTNKVGNQLKFAKQKGTVFNRSFLFFVLMVQKSTPLFQMVSSRPAFHTKQHSFSEMKGLLSERSIGVSVTKVPAKLTQAHLSMVAGVTQSPLSSWRQE